MSSIVLTHPSAGSGGAPLALALPRELLWIDEFGWQQVEQSSEYTTTGALIVEATAKQAGRPITLDGAVDRAWCERGTLATLRGWAAEPARVLALALHGHTRSVLFDHARGAIEARPFEPLLAGGSPARYTAWGAAGTVLQDVEVDYFDPRPTDPFSVTLRFIMV